MLIWNHWITSCLVLFCLFLCVQLTSWSGVQRRARGQRLGGGGTGSGWMDRRMVVLGASADQWSMDNTEATDVCKTLSKHSMNVICIYITKEKNVGYNHIICCGLCVCHTSSERQPAEACTDVLTVASKKKRQQQKMQPHFWTTIEWDDGIITVMSCSFGINIVCFGLQLHKSELFHWSGQPHQKKSMEQTTFGTASLLAYCDRNIAVQKRSAKCVLMLVSQYERISAEHNLLPSHQPQHLSPAYLTSLHYFCNDLVYATPSCLSSIDHAVGSLRLTLSSLWQLWICMCPHDWCCRKGWSSGHCVNWGLTASSSNKMVSEFSEMAEQKD